MKSPEQIKEKLYEIIKLNEAECDKFADGESKERYSTIRDKLDVMYDTLMWVSGYCEEINLI